MKNLNIFLEDGYIRKEPVIRIRTEDIDKTNYIGNNKIYVTDGNKPLFDLGGNTRLENLTCVLVEKSI